MAAAVHRLQLVPGMKRRSTAAAYFRALERLPLLSPARERELAIAYRASGSPALEARLVAAHLRLVVKLVSRYAWSPVPLDDLIQEGNLGLLQAVRHYDPGREVRLTTYAAWWIRARVLRYLADNHRLVRVGKTNTQRRIMFRMRDEQARLEQELERSPTRDELARRLGVEVNVLEKLGGHFVAPEARLDSAHPLREEPRVWHLEARDADRPDRQVEVAERDALVRAAAAEFETRLTGRDRVLFRKRWAEHRADPPTLAALGLELGLSRERMRQIERRILDGFRRYLGSRLASGELALLAA